jgi:uncharacterized OB-fold protein
MTSEAVAVHPGLFAGGAGQDSHLIGGLCAACARSHFPRLETCPYCSASGCRPHALPREGTLYLYTAVLNRPPGYRGEVPYGFGVVQLSDGLRVVTRLTEADVARLRPGMPMRLVITPLHRDDMGRDVLSYAFAPAQ